MNLKKIYLIVIFLQLIVFLYFMLLQSILGVPSLNLFPRLFSDQFLEAIIPSFLGSLRESKYLIISAFFPLVLIGIYAITYRLNSSVMQSFPIFYFWFYAFNIVFFILFATLARAYLGFILIILYCGLLYLFLKSVKKAQMLNRDKNIILAKIYVYYFVLNLLYVPMQLGIFALFYMGN